MKDAILFKQLKDQLVRCNLCSHRCLIGDGERGLCQVRENHGGVLKSLSYDKVIATAVDPIEKKPLYHFYPGSRSYSIATVGCNFTCEFCQNHHISQYLLERSKTLPGQAIQPETLVAEAKESGSKTIAFTYTEPTVFAELAYETASLARDDDIASVFVSNGYMSAEMLAHFGDLIAAANIDLKAFREQSYRNKIGGSLKPVLRNIETLYDAKRWVELTTLVIPFFNDSPDELRDMAEFIHDISPDIPWHLSAFHPDYHMRDRDRTDLATLRRAYDIAKTAGLNYVYIGNIMRDDYGSTICPKCGECVIKRRGFMLGEVKLAENQCTSCGHRIAGVF